MRGRRVPSVTALLGLCVLLGGAAAGAQEPPRRPAIAFQENQDLPAVLRQYLGQTVTLRLVSGTELRGRVEKVGERLVHLSRLSGREFYDAVVALEDVSAFELQVR